MSIGTLGLAFLAGLLSILSPCVLPLLPIVLGAAASEHRLGPIALAAGMALSFVSIGLFIATIGFGLGLDGDVFRFVAAALMIVIGGILVVPPLQTRLATAGGPIGKDDWAQLPSIDGAIGGKNLRAETLGDRGRRLGAGCRHPVREHIGIEARHAAPPELIQHVALARRDPAG